MTNWLTDNEMLSNSYVPRTPQGQGTKPKKLYKKCKSHIVFAMLSLGVFNKEG